jgi:hypothetical protein
MTDFDNTNSGILGKNDRRREGKNDAEYTGQINVDGVEYWLNAWVKERKDKSGKFFSLSVRPKQPRQDAPTQKAHDNEDDSIPF